MVSRRDYIIEKSREVIAQYNTKLTLRQIFYRLVSAQIIENTRSQYGYLSSILSRAREDGIIPFDAIEDQTRQAIGDGRRAVVAPEEYVLAFLEDLRNCSCWYSVPLWHGQPQYVEIWLEKQALATLFREVTESWGVVLAPNRGYSSVTFIHEGTQRIKEFQEENPGVSIYIRYFGDFDPSGEDIYRFVQEKFKKYGVEADFRKVALTPELISQYALPPSPAKKTDTRAAKFIEKNGDVAVELDALDPPILQALVTSTIEELFDHNIRLARDELKQKNVDEVRRIINRVLQGVHT